MNVRLTMYQVLLFKFGRHLCKGSIVGDEHTFLEHNPNSDEMVYEMNHI